MQKATKNQVEKNFNRFKQIKKELDANSYTRLFDIRDKVGGHINIYSLLRNEGIMVQNQKSKTFKWNGTIPVTLKLSKTISDKAYTQIKETHKEGVILAGKVTLPRPKNTKKPVPKSVVNSYKKPSKPISAEVITRKPKSTVKTKQPKSRFEFNIGWGFIKVIRN